MNTFCIISCICIFAILASNARRIHSRATRCGSSAVPAIDFIERGVDVTQLNLFNCPSPKGLKHKLFNYDDCSDGQRWFFEKGNRTYSVPNSFKLLVTSKNYGENGQMLTTMDPIRKKFSETVDIDDYHDELFANNDLFIRLQSELAGKSIVIADKHYEHYSIEVDEVQRSKQVNNELLASARSLPSDFDKRPIPYIEFIKKFGTHYIKSAIFGGVNQRITAIWNNVTTDPGRVAEIGNHEFPDFLSFPANRGVCYNQKRNYIAKFENLQTQYGYAWFEQTILGGRTDLMWRNGYEAWVESIPEDVYLIKIRLEPITDLLPAGEQKREMTAALDTYMARGKLDESIRALEIHIKNETLINNAPSFSAEDLLREAENMKQEDNYNLRRIKEVINNIQKEIRGEKSLPVQESTTTRRTTTTTTSTERTNDQSPVTPSSTPSTTTSTAAPEPPTPQQNEVKDKDNTNAAVTKSPAIVVCVLFIINLTVLNNYYFK